MNRYGAAEVESWRFEFWNEPELIVFWPGSEQEYHELYLATYRTVKRISEALKIGAPGRIITVTSPDTATNFSRFAARTIVFLTSFRAFYPHEEIENEYNRRKRSSSRTKSFTGGRWRNSEGFRRIPIFLGNDLRRSRRRSGVIWP